MRKGFNLNWHQTEDIHTVIFGNFVGKVGKLASWQLGNLANPLVFYSKILLSLIINKL